MWAAMSPHQDGEEWLQWNGAAIPIFSFMLGPWSCIPRLHIVERVVEEDRRRGSEAAAGLAGVSAAGWTQSSNPPSVVHAREAHQEMNPGRRQTIEQERCGPLGTARNAGILVAVVSLIGHGGCSKLAHRAACLSKAMMQASSLSMSLVIAASPHHQVPVPTEGSPDRIVCSCALVKQHVGV